MSALSSESRLFPGFADLEFLNRRFVAVAAFGAPTKLMNLTDCRHEPVLFGHLTPATSGLQERADCLRTRQNRRCPITVFRAIETFLNTQ
jgi:hypothetical protein